MNKIISLSALTMLLSITASAKIWRVNNVGGIIADFISAQQAHDNIQVLPGDTLHIEPSGSSYGSLTMTKRLTIISTGFFLAANSNVQYSPLTGALVNITIANINANGSVLHCNMNGLSLNGVSNIRVERCHLESTFTISGSTSIAVLNNYLYFVSLNTNSTSILISNNIISGSIDMSSSASATISNNVLMANSQGSSTAQIYNSTYQNNIINKAGLTLTFFSSVVQNNISSGTQLSAGNGNQNNVSMPFVFVNPLGTDDISFKLLTSGTNPAVGTGTNGIDCGAFGGSAPFVPGLQAAIPAIYKIVGPVTPSGNTMNVIFSTRSNN